MRVLISVQEIDYVLIDIPDYYKSSVYRLKDDLYDWYQNGSTNYSIRYDYSEQEYSEKYEVVSWIKNYLSCDDVKIIDDNLNREKAMELHLSNNQIIYI